MPSANTAAIEEIFRLARRADHRSLRSHLHDDATWHPAREGAWKPCTSADEIVRTLLWRADANRLRPGEMIDLGKGFIPRLFQIVVLREGKVVSIRDYAKREEALTAAGIKQ